MKSKPDQLQRRSFLKKFTIYSVSICVLPSCVGKGEEIDAPLLKPECQTTADILGPFYKPNAPLRENIIPEGASGEPLIVKGKVYGDCETVLEDALVEIWNADSEGEYDEVKSATFNFRGSNKTNVDGDYKFKTIVPGKYLNGSIYRPSHIHFKITATGYRDLVSQIYFKDDPHISTDRWASDPKAENRILSFQKDSEGIDNVNFDIFLVKA